MHNCLKCKVLLRVVCLIPAERVSRLVNSSASPFRIKATGARGAPIALPLVITRCCNLSVENPQPLS